MAELETIMLGGTAEQNAKKINSNFTKLNDQKADKTNVVQKDNTEAYTPATDYEPATKKYVDDSVKELGAGDMKKAIYDTNSDGSVDSADKVAHALVFKTGAGATEGTNKFTFDGSAAKEIAIAAGSNVQITTPAAGTLQIEATDTVTKLKTTNDPASVTLDGTEKSGSVTFGDAASKVVSTSIPATPTTAQQAMLPNLAAIKAYCDALLDSNNAMVFKGVIGTDTGMLALPTTGYQAGWTYKVGTAGTYAGAACEVGDTILCVKDYSSSFQNSDFYVFQANIDGAVTSSDANPVVSGTVPVYDGTTGKLIKSGGHTLGKDVPSDAKFTDTVYSVIKTTFTAADSRWSSTATDGAYSLTIDCASGRFPAVIYRLDSGTYKAAMCDITISGTSAIIKSYDKFEGYAVIV